VYRKTSTRRSAPSLQAGELSRLSS
jgi:hypothetical protein